MPWDTRYACVFIPSGMTWKQQLEWNESAEYSAYFLALTANDNITAAPLNGRRVDIVDLSMAENKLQFQEALKAAAEGQIEILGRNISSMRLAATAKSA